MFKKILIANRGAIACRIIRTLKKMRITAVAIYAEADRDSLHVEQADEAYSLGEGGAAPTYLDQNKIIQIAKTAGAEAIHPGYGFLSENPDFVRLCEEQALVFIGPGVKNMRDFARKHKARALAREFQVPLLPGSPLLRDKAEAVVAANEIGYPVMLKSSAGGGGIGMQVCRDREVLAKAFDSVVRLSQNNFADGSVFVEKYIAHARHLEVQVFGDGRGAAVDLGERDCSLQRRNQKVIEEAPAPNISATLRQTLHHTACKLLAGVNYSSAGTVEFIYDPRAEKFYFLEVNTRLQVEHGVSEEVYGVDLVRWMVEHAHSPITDLTARRAALQPRGHAIQVRLYAENPANNFQPCAGLLSHVRWPQYSPDKAKLRVDSWVSSGIEVSPHFDPMLAKIIVRAADRATANTHLQDCLAGSEIYGIATNLDYITQLLRSDIFRNATLFTRFLDTWQCAAPAIEVLSSGTMTSVQDLPGRTGYWEVGVPPSGPFDSCSFRLGNHLLDNAETCAGLEITLSGPSIKFYAASQIAVTGAKIDIDLDGETQAGWSVIDVHPGQVLTLGKIARRGARAYLLIKGGVQCPDYLGSKSTFTLGGFGGHCGRALKTGDVLKIPPLIHRCENRTLAEDLRPRIQNDWVLHVVYGPHGAPDFFTRQYMATFFNAHWEVHYNSSRTGIRLIGPNPEWARESGGEAGMHPSNIHDNAYAFGTVDFTGDMPVILGPDGPSLGGFVCPATVIDADLWKLGQLRAGDKVRFQSVAIAEAVDRDRKRRADAPDAALNALLPTHPPATCILKTYTLKDLAIQVRPAGDRFVLIEFGEQQLDLRLRFRVYALRQFLQDFIGKGIIDLCPGIRSLQVHYDPQRLPRVRLLATVEKGLGELERLDDVRIPSRLVHLPLSWDDDACRLAVEKYMQSVRRDAPWCPDNIEFIRRINGLRSIDEVKAIVFQARYVVMGLGDVYLGAPVATPLDPRHRLVTTKYNPARTWTAENSVGIGGAYLCIYGMEGPGGYQFIGRTLQMWNHYRKTAEFSQPWLLRFFDQLCFYPVSHDELHKIRRDFPKGNYPLKIEQQEFSLREYEDFVACNADSIEKFQQRRQAAFDRELQYWKNSGHFHFDSSPVSTGEADPIPQGLTAIESAVAGSVWQVLVEEGQRVRRGDPLVILESMKMEIEVAANVTGTVHSIVKPVGAVVSAGQALVYIEERRQ